MIVCCGEALIDMIPCKYNNELVYTPKIGGAVLNTSIALGRLETKVAFLACISKDIFGNMIVDELKKSNVDTSLCMSTSCHTTLAFTTIKDGSATYDFFDENSSNQDISLKKIPLLKSEVNTLFIGGISLMSEPNGSEIEEFVNKESLNKVVFFDPNIRPDFIKDKKIYMNRFENILSQTNIIKVSDEDLQWLYGNESFDKVVNIWLEQGVDIVILTKGSEGAVVKTKNYTISSTVEKVKVVDTIGAGDTFNAGFLSALIKDSNFSKDSLINIGKESLENALKFANKVAGINVGRAGANPPFLNELNL